VVDLLRMPTKALRASVSLTGDPSDPAFGERLTERLLVPAAAHYGDQVRWQGRTS
jgi:hypothetical protein